MRVVLMIVLSTLVVAGVAACSPPTNQRADTVADAVPISVNIVPSPAASPTKIDITITMNATVILDTPLLVFYDVRNPAGADPDRHIDADLVLQLKPEVREVTCPAGSSSHTFSVDLNATRAIASEVSVAAVTKTSKKGAACTKAVPASGS